VKKKIVRLGKNDVVQVGEGKKGQGIRIGTAEIIKPIKDGFKVMPQVKPKVQIYKDPDTNKKYKVGDSMKGESQENRQKWKDGQAKLAARRKTMGFKERDK
jgi:hypothetical protein